MNGIAAKRVFRTAAALVAGTALATSASANRLASVGSDEYWVVTPAEQAPSDLRPHVEIRPAHGPALKLPIVVLDGTRYTATMTHTVGTHANPVNPRAPLLAPERRLTLAVAARPDFVPGSTQRDKVQLTFSDKYRGHDLEVDIEKHEQRYVAFDIQFHPTYELQPNSHFVIHFQGLQVGMGKHVMAGTGEPPFSIRVRGTNPLRRPDPLGPIDLRFERRWWDGRTAAVQEELLPDDGLDAMQRGRWYRIVLRLVPGYDDGEIFVWHWDLAQAYDRCDIPQHQWNVPWGYKPILSGDPRTDAHRRTIQYGVGIYRRATDRTQRIQLRNIRYGTNYDDVVPGLPCR